MTPYTPDPNQHQLPVTGIAAGDTPTRPLASPPELRQPETTLYHDNTDSEVAERDSLSAAPISSQPLSHPSTSSVSSAVNDSISLPSASSASSASSAVNNSSHPSVSSVSSVVKSKLPRGLFSPRLALLAALLYNPAILIAYLLYLYGPVNTCVVGSLCSFGAYSAPVQALLILAGSAILWLLLSALVLRAIESPGRKTGLVRLLRDLSRYERIRELLLVYGALLALLLVVSLLTRRLTLPAFIVGAFGLFVSLYCATSTPPSPESAPFAIVAPLLPSPPQRGGVGGEEPHP